ncbi:phenylalanine--tRNA ligase subunit beta [Candidatus Micrarchaeota archaeon]|nr:phenylalanine--tRNA ligase subunit beta [Candidatus Micrarchaeota archaeon]
MGVVRANKKYLEKKCGLKERKLIDVLTNIGLPVEIEDEQYVIEITPDRPDLYFIEGIVRVVSAYSYGKKHRYSAKKSRYEIEVDKNVEKIRPYISSCVVKGVKLEEEDILNLIDVQEKLHQTVGRKRKKAAIGIHNFDVIEFPLTYSVVKEKKFIPLEYSEEMGIGRILAEHPKGVEYSHLVEDGKYPLIEAKNGVVAFPPIINADRTKLGKGVKNIFVDCTGTHKETVEGIVNMIACALADTGGEIYAVKINGEVHPKLEYPEIALKTEWVNKILGTQLKKEEMNCALEKMDYVERKGGIFSQPYRMDIIGDVDIMEDVAIGMGYDYFKPTLPEFFTSGKLTEKTKKEETATEIMIGMGFLEITTPTLADMGKCLEKPVLKIKNPLNVENTTLRNKLLESGLTVLKENKMKGIPQKLFEIGEIYDGGVKQRVMMLIMDKSANFNEIRSCAQRFFWEMNIEYRIKGKKSDYMKGERSGEIFSGKKKIGEIGEIADEILKSWDIPFPVAYCEVEI